MADALKVAVVAFEDGPDARHVVEIDESGVTRRVVVRVAEEAWLGLAWLGHAEGHVRNIVERYVRLHAADGTLADDEFIGGDEASDIHWGRK